jgi:hypothetical protein
VDVFHSRNAAAFEVADLQAFFLFTAVALPGDRTKADDLPHSCSQGLLEWPGKGRLPGSAGSRFCGDALGVAKHDILSRSHSRQGSSTIRSAMGSPS